jgi:hypothetical protein
LSFVVDQKRTRDLEAPMAYPQPQGNDLPCSRTCSPYRVVQEQSHDTSTCIRHTPPLPTFLTLRTAEPMVLVSVRPRKVSTVVLARCFLLFSFLRGLRQTDTQAHRTRLHPCLHALATGRPGPSWQAPFQTHAEVRTHTHRSVWSASANATVLWPPPPAGGAA